MSNSASSSVPVHDDGGTQRTQAGGPTSHKRSLQSSCRRAQSFRSHGLLCCIRREWEDNFNPSLEMGNNYHQFTAHNLHDLNDDQLQSHLLDWTELQNAAQRHAAHISDASTEAARMAEKAIVPRFGSLDGQKQQGRWRFLYVQANGLADPLRRRQKLGKMMKLAQDYDVDGIAICEVGVNWKGHSRRHRLGDWVNPLSPREIRASSSFNTSGPTSSLAQQGGTALIMLHGLLQYTQSTANDFRNLGRWASWILSSNPAHRTRVVVAYCPGKAKKSGLKTVYQQHLRHIQTHNLRCSPYKLFIFDFCKQLRTWRTSGDRILLFIDANDHILNSKISRSLTECDTFWPPNEAPHTHIAGSSPIDGIFCSPDLDCCNLISLLFHESIGDHRSMIVELSSLSVLGQPQGSIVRPTSRRLTTKQPSSVLEYNAAFSAQCAAHNIHLRTTELMGTVQQEGFPVSTATSQQILTLHTQMDQIKAHAESVCQKILKPESPFSPP